jgi:hypothetical protein
MSLPTEGRLSEALALVATIDPDAYGTGTQNTDVIDMKYHRRVIFVVMAGTLGSSAVLNFAVKADTASNGSFTTTLSGKSITPLTDAGTDSDKQAIVEVTAEEVAAEGFRYLRGLATLTIATSDYGAVALASHARYSPASEFDLSTVDEIVA